MSSLCFSSYSESQFQVKNVDLGNSYNLQVNISESVSDAKFHKLKKPQGYWYLDKIRELNQLKCSDIISHYPDTDCPNAYALYWADFVLDHLRVIDFPCTKVSASVDEGVAICFISGDKYADLEIFNSQEILAVKSSRSSEPVLWSVSDDPYSIENAISSIRDYINA